MVDVSFEELGISSLSILDRLNIKILPSKVENLMDKFNSNTSYIRSCALLKHMFIQTDVPYTVQKLLTF